MCSLALGNSDNTEVRVTSAAGGVLAVHLASSTCINLAGETVAAAIGAFNTDTKGRLGALQA